MENLHKNKRVRFNEDIEYNTEYNIKHYSLNIHHSNENNENVNIINIFHNDMEIETYIKNFDNLMNIDNIKYNKIKPLEISTCKCNNYIFCIESLNCFRKCKTFNKVQLFYPLINMLYEELRPKKYYLLLNELIKMDDILYIYLDDKDYKMMESEFNEEYGNFVKNIILFFFRINKTLNEYDKILANILLFNFTIIHFTFIRAIIPNITKTFVKKMIDIKTRIDIYEKYKYILNLYHCKDDIIEMWIEQINKFF